MINLHAKQIAVIGAGIIGLCVAERLLSEGHSVCLIDPGVPGGAQAASYGNGAFISPASVVPMTGPGLWRQVPKMLLDPTGALSVRLRDLPRLLPWLLAFLCAGNRPEKVSCIAHELNILLRDAPLRHADLAARAGLPELIRQTGLLYAFQDRAAWLVERQSWDLRADCGVVMQECDSARLRDLAPDLAPEYRFGLLIGEGAYCVDPGGYVAGLAHDLTRAGAQIRRDRVLGLDLTAGRLRGLRCEGGDVPCTDVVIAAGIASAPFARQAGDRVPLAAERGYHVEIANAPINLDVPVMPQDGKMANVTTRGGLRAAGQVEIASPDAPPNWARADVLLAHLERSYPALRGQAHDLRRWMGCRPSLPDGKPVIGRATGSPNVFYAFGHGHIGLASAPATAEIVADLIEGRRPRRDALPFSPARFRSPRGPT
ncbi:NAD(P)/FAD-dependent oxidoreductase [Celeribacter persicus]|uniref:D-amino-acid dehydrogenase n=1 Tax=Celeribacter persicus TaxID=1651082 RepID=A0A2T5H5J1_9RHOB|nr:FAD-binding oxidoreductase [Celeribacter persicus]PTQ66817.1 D-amino-acid dehydrogenase [Celeribacter persicus]